MAQSFRPSRQFLIRGGIALGIVLLILTTQAAWFRGLFNKKPLEKLDPETTVGDIVTKDSNGNTIPDWEEKLWGLDPEVLYTNGVSNREIIEQKKKALGIQSNIGGENPNDTDKLARDLFAISTALGQMETIDDAALQGVASTLGANIDIKQVSNHYSIKDITTVKTTSASLNQYYDAVGALISQYESGTNELDVIIEGLETGDFSRLPQLTSIGIQYRQIANDLVKIRAPIGISGSHLAIVNAFYGVAESFTYMQALEENGIQGLAGIAIYKTYTLRLQAALADLRDYFVRYGIIAA